MSLMKKDNKELLVIVQYPEHVSPGQRFRVELYKDLLLRNGFRITTRPFLDKHGYDIIHKYGFFFTKSIAILKGFLSRLLLIFSIKKYDFIFLQREATPIGPPVFEWVIVKLLRRKVIYDFDDAIWINLVSEQNRLATLLKNTGKVSSICRWAYKVSCGNRYLCDYALQYNSNVVYNPTCVDVLYKHNIAAKQDVDKITIGWTGSFSTVVYLDIVKPALKRLQEKYDFNIKIICNREPSLGLKNVKYVQWTEDNEVLELSSCQIGLMPLNYDEWANGKCGFKIIQYFALEIPAVSSPVGVNKTIIEEGVNGYFANSDMEWYTAIERLLLNADLRKTLGKAGRKKVVEQFSLQSNETNFLALFQ